MPDITDPPARSSRRRSLIGLPEAAQLLGVHYMTAYRYIRTGRLRAELVNGVWRVDPAEVRAMSKRSLPPRTVGGSRSRSVAMLEVPLLHGDEAGAFAVVENALSSWATPGDVLTEMVVPAMRHIGERWRSGEITVADEHQAAGVAMRIIGRLGPRFAHRGRHRGTVVVGVPAGDRHGLPSAIAADLLREVGFRVVDLGADTPADAFVEIALGADRLIAVGLGSTLPKNQRSVTATIGALHGRLPGVPVILGGAAVTSQAVARRLGADLWSGTDGRTMVQLALDQASTSS